MNTTYSPNPRSTRNVAAVSALDWIALVLLIIGGLNWGLVGAFSFDLVAAILGEMTLASRAVYILVGLAALYGIYFASRLAAARNT